MMVRLSRFLLAIAFLATASFAAVADVHSGCHPDTQSEHEAGHSHENPGQDSESEIAIDLGEVDRSAKGEASLCHGGFGGCAGCISAPEQALYEPSVSTAAFRLAAAVGESADTASNLRPPKAS